MQNSVLSQILVVFLVFVAPFSAFSQQNDVDAPAAAPQPAPQTDAAPDNQGADAPQIQIAAVHKDWQIRCREQNDCYLSQLVTDNRDAPIAELNVDALSGETGALAGISIITPLRTLLTEGLTFQIDSNQPQKYPFFFCAFDGCVSRFGYDAVGLGQLKRGNIARVTIVPVDRADTPVILDVSLAGFTAAIEELTEMKAQ